MPRTMPPLGVRFSREVNRALSLARAGELVRATSPSGSVAVREFSQSRLEALYEMAYLRVFMLWETFLEQSFLRYICGFAASAGPQSLTGGTRRTLFDAEQAVLRGHDYVSWANPGSVEARCRHFIKYGLHEQIVSSNRSRLEWFASVRHRVAHPSAYAKGQFDTATMGLAGRRYRGSSPGRFLRDRTPGLPHRERWIREIGDELTSLARQIVP
jgi:hypothetical protein